MDDNKEAKVKNSDETKILEQITELDFEYDSFLSNHVAVRASLAQGKNKNISINIFRFSLGYFASKKFRPENLSAFFVIGL